MLPFSRWKKEVTQRRNCTNWPHNTDNGGWAQITLWDSILQWNNGPQRRTAAEERRQPAAGLARCHASTGENLVVQKWGLWLRGWEPRLPHKNPPRKEPCTVAYEGQTQCNCPLPRSLWKQLQGDEREKRLDGKTQGRVRTADWPSVSVSNVSRAFPLMVETVSRRPFSIYLRVSSSTELFCEKRLCRFVFATFVAGTSLHSILSFACVSSVCIACAAHRFSVYSAFID